MQVVIEKKVRTGIQNYSDQEGIGKIVLAVLEGGAFLLTSEASSPKDLLRSNAFSQPGIGITFL